MLLILYCINAAACKAHHLETLCPWERRRPSEQSRLQDNKHGGLWRGGAVLACTPVCLKRDSLTSGRVKSETPQQLGTFRLQGLMSINPTKGCSITDKMVTIAA